MMRLAALGLCLCLGLGLALGPVHGGAPQPSRRKSDISQSLEATLAQGHTSLNDMFREVEKLMEDTQHKLEEAVYQMDNESAKSNFKLDELPANYHNKSNTERKVGNTAIHTVQKIDKMTDNNTGSTFFSKTVIQSRRKENEIDRECIIDEDCGKRKYCFYELLQSRCLPCKTLESICTKDEECCEGQLCVWGRCSDNTTKGEAGSICQYQTECKAELCCAFHKVLLFPVCTPKPTEGERCHSTSNHLLDLLSWDMEGEGPRESCPCSRGLSCQPHRRGSVCERRRHSSSEEFVTETLNSDWVNIV